MTAGETLLKVADYPFAYTFVMLVGGIFGFSIIENKLLLLGIAGALGTFLTIVDPWGLYVKYQLRNRLNKLSRQSSKVFPEIKFHFKAINSRAMGIEIDRIIGMIYFALGLFIFIIAMWSPYSFADNFIIKDKNQNTVCNTNCIQISSSIVAITAMYILSISGRKKWNELDRKLEVAAMHQFSIGHEYATKAAVENMTRSIDLGDWTSAEEWAKEIRKEIDNKKGKREVIIKSAEFVFRLLHEDSIVISESCSGILNAKQYFGITANMWNQIKRSGTHVMVDEIDLRRKIDNFYNLIVDYNKLSSQLNNIVDILIKEQMTNVFLKKIRNIRYFVQYSGTHSDPNLVGCALFKIHPLKHRQNVSVSPLQLDIEFQNEPTIIAKSENDFARFDLAWKTVLIELEKNDDIPKLKEILDKIMTDNQTLISVYEDKIAAQWKV